MKSLAVQTALFALNAPCARRRNSRGANIAEFAVALFALFLCGLLPLCNVVSFAASLNSVQQLALVCARDAAMADTREMALRSAQSINALVKNPTMCALHNVQPLKTNLDLVSTAPNGTRSIYPIEPNSRSRTSVQRGNQYSIQLHFSCSISPLINLTGIPVVGQVPIIGSSAEVHLQPEVPIENPAILEL